MLYLLLVEIVLVVLVLVEPKVDVYSARSQFQGCAASAKRLGAP